jgi:UDP-galactopyranose mutase
MRAEYDFLVVGAGFAGSVVAERLAAGSGKSVMLCDRRDHIGGNAYDQTDEAGILVHKYGPHIFHTNSREIFDYLSRFTAWRAYEHRVLALVEGKLLPIPINLDTINKLYDLRLSEREVEQFLAARAIPCESPRTSEQVTLSRVGRDLYEKFFRSYTRKQWGLDPSELDAQVAARIPVRTNRDDRYFTDQFQSMPKHGFTRMFENMLDHPHIDVLVGIDYRDLRKQVKFRELIFTGPVDEFFDFRFGKLPYRSLRFEHKTLNQEWHQPVAVVNYPNNFDYTRVTEFKHLTGQQHSRTSIVYEYPQARGDAYYPIPQPANAAIYARYRELAQNRRDVHFVGRLATYRYYNMDQVIGQALTLYRKLVQVEARPVLERTNREAALQSA